MQVADVTALLEDVSASGRNSARRRASLLLLHLKDLPLLD